MLLTDGYYTYKMDLWAVGCVFYEVLSLHPLFPGKDEVDQVHKVHKILGSPPADLLKRYESQASHMEFNFPDQKGSGFSKLIPHVSKGKADLRIDTVQRRKI